MTVERVRIAEGGRDLDAAVRSLERIWSSHGWHAAPTGRDFVFRHTATGTPALMLRSTTFRGRIEGRFQKSDAVMVGWLGAGEASMRAGEDIISSDIGHPLVLPSDDGYQFSYRDCTQHLLQVDTNVVQRVAAERDGGPVRPVKFVHGASPEGAKLAAWWRAVDAIARRAHSAEVERPLMQQELARLAAEAILDAFPYQQEEPVPALIGPRAVKVRAAVDFLTANAHQPIGVEDAAAAAGLSLRGLQQAFARTLGVAPHAYLRGVRLERTRDELLSARPGERTVAEIAAAWGFAHAGRFSAEYARRFGEAPSTTLRSSPSESAAQPRRHAVRGG